MSPLAKFANTSSEWDRASDYVYDRLDNLLVALSRGREIRDYVGNLKGYPRVLYLCAAWIEDPSIRFRAGTAFCVHAAGMKLMDDIIDGDQNVRPRDLILGHVFCEDAVEAFNSINPEIPLVSDFHGRWMPIWNCALSEADNSIVTVEQWRENALRKSGQWMAAYGEAACRLSGRFDLAPAVTSILETAGIIYMISDDIRDHSELNEVDNNIFALLTAGLASQDAVIGLFENQVRYLLGALEKCPPFFDFWPALLPVINRSRDKLIAGA